MFDPASALYSLGVMLGYGLCAARPKEEEEPAQMAPVELPPEPEVVPPPSDDDAPKEAPKKLIEPAGDDRDRLDWVRFACDYRQRKETRWDETQDFILSLLCQYERDGGLTIKQWTAALRDYRLASWRRQEQKAFTLREFYGSGNGGKPQPVRVQNLVVHDSIHTHIPKSELPSAAQSLANDCRYSSLEKLRQEFAISEEEELRQSISKVIRSRSSHQPHTLEKARDVLRKQWQVGDSEFLDEFGETCGSDSDDEEFFSDGHWFFQR